MVLTVPWKYKDKIKWLDVLGCVKLTVAVSDSVHYNWQTFLWEITMFKWWIAVIQADGTFGSYWTLWANMPHRGSFLAVACSFEPRPWTVPESRTFLSTQFCVALRNTRAEILSSKCWTGRSPLLWMPSQVRLTSWLETAVGSVSKIRMVFGPQKQD